MLGRLALKKISITSPYVEVCVTGEYADIVSYYDGNPSYFDDRKTTLCGLGDVSKESVLTHQEIVRFMILVMIMGTV